MRSELLRKLFLWYRSKWRRFPRQPPYHHICQVGDPILRGKALPVEVNKITTPEIKKIITRMVSIMESKEYVGLSAPQVGISYQILIMKLPAHLLKRFPVEVIRNQEMAIFPLKIFINPEMQITDPRKIIFTEGCASLLGFSAEVPRFSEVKISGYNEDGVFYTWQTRGFSARIIQHEMDHLHGKLYIDSMDSRTFENTLWYQVNVRGKNYSHIV